MSEALIEYVAPWLIDHPEELHVEVVQGERNAVVLEVSLHPDDMGKIIGRQGRIIRSLRTLARAAGQRQGQNITIEVID
jgi:uncharacterized protein